MWKDVCINPYLFPARHTSNALKILLCYISSISLSFRFASSFPRPCSGSPDDMLERTQGIVRLHDIDVVAIKHLIDYIYTGEITITEQNVQVLLPASSLLQMHSVREACCKFLLRQLHPSNCLGIRSFAGNECPSRIGKCF